MRLNTKLCHVGCVALAITLAVPPASASATATTTVVVNPETYSCSQPGFIDFEELADGTQLDASAIQGVQFTTTGGYTWKVGDFSTGSYNGKYPAGSYTSKGNHWAWLGPDQGTGRIDFPGGKVSYFSVLTSANTPVYLEAYDSNNVLLETAGPAAANIGTGQMGELKIQRTRADVHHVIVHDSGNYFTVDAICTNARGVVTPKTKVALLGDSYSAGVGLGKVTDGCDRDSGAYGPRALARLQKEDGMQFDVSNVACSGAVTVDYWNGSDTSAVQRDAITAETQIVALTFGGNDLNFADRLTDCYFLCKDAYKNIDAAYGTNTSMTWDYLHLRLVNMYVDIRQKMARSGHVYVLSYPIPFALAQKRSACELLSDQDQLAGNTTSTRIGDTTWIAVQTANAQLEAQGIPGNIEMLDWRTGTRVTNGYTAPNGSTFDAYTTSPNGLCTLTRGAKEFIQGYHDELSKQQDNSFHPTKDGYAYAAGLLVNAIRVDFPSSMN